TRLLLLHGCLAEMKVLQVFRRVQVVLTTDHLFERGTIVIPLKRSADKMNVFIPCGGPDASTDNLPEWVGDVPVSDIVR
ncbi:MAG: hypothetical protein ABGX43_09660, partial [Nitrospinaceae bacterium]